MKSLKRFVSSMTIFTCALCLPFNTALAKESQLIDTAPEGGFYYLEDTENKSFLVHACSSEVDYDGKLIIDNKCPVVAEVVASHLEEFLDEIESRQNPAPGKSLLYRLTGAGLAVLTAAFYVKYKKVLPSIALGLVSGSTVFYGNHLASRDRRNTKHYSAFETQIRAGIIGKGPKLHFLISKDESNRLMLEEFTNFINQYGVPFEAEETLASPPELN